MPLARCARASNLHRLAVIILAFIPSAACFLLPTTLLATPSLIMACALSAKAQTDAAQDTDSCRQQQTCDASSQPTISLHSKDDSIVLVHAAETESTQDLAKELLRDEGFCNDLTKRNAICVTTTQQTNGRGTNGRRWLSRRGNTFVTMAIRCNAWTQLPMTLLPLAMGLVMAQQIEPLLLRLWKESCFSDDGAAAAVDRPRIPKPTVNIKWPNDVLVNQRKIAGVLIEMDESREWFLIGVGVNVKVAPTIDANDGRPSTSIAEYLCGASASPQWDDKAQQLGVDITYGLVEFMNAMSRRTMTQDLLLAKWKQHVDWTVPLVLRDGDDKTPVLPISIKPDGRLVVQDTVTRQQRVMVSDYFV